MKIKRISILKAFVLGTIFILILFFPFCTEKEGFARKIKTFEELEKAIEKTQHKLESNPEDADLLCCLSRLLLMNGNYDAERYLQKALKNEPEHLESLLTLSKLYWRKHIYEEGERILAKAATLAPDKLPVRMLQAKFALDKMDFAKAEEIYKELLKKYPDSAEVLYGMAEVMFELERFDESENLINKCIQVDPKFAKAFSLYSQIHLRRQAKAELKETIRKALELDPFDAEARVRLAFILTRLEAKPQEGYQQAKIALKLDPYSHSAHTFLGNGCSPFDYKDEKMEGDEKTIKTVEKFLKEGDEFLLNREFAKAEKTFNEVLKLNPQNITGMIGMGTLNYHQRNYEMARDWFFKILKINPDHGLAHYGISQVFLRMKDRVNVKLPEMEKKFASMDAPEWPYLRDVFINYDQLDPELQKIVRLTVAPLSDYLKYLKIAGATFYLIPFHKFIWQSPHHAHLKGKRTFDLRLWDDLKGCGGLNSTTGADWQRDYKYFRANILTHEFTHQVHRFLAKEQKEEVKRLFLKAKKERRTLSYYADYNDQEYLATGVSAYTLEEKLGVGFTYQDLSEYSRKDILEIDPDLCHFIEKIYKPENYREHEIQAYIEKGRSKISKGDLNGAIKVYAQALGAYGTHPELLDALGSAYRIKGENDKAIKTHEQAMHEFPEDVSAYISLAYDYLLIKRDPLKAIGILEATAKRYPESFELFIKLGQLCYLAGELDKMEKYFKQAILINPYPPNPSSPLEPYHKLARGLLAKEDYVNAEKNYTYSLEQLNRGRPQAWAELAYLFLKTGREEEGKKHLHLAQKLNPELPQVKEIKALYLSHQGNDLEAQSILEKILEEYPERIETRIQLADLIEETNLDKAVRLLMEGLKIVSRGEPVKYILKGNNFQELDLFEQPAVSRLYTAYALLIEKKGRIEEAIKYHKEALKFFKYNYNSGVSLVRLYKQKNMLEEAQRIFEELKKINLPRKYLKECQKYL